MGRGTAGHFVRFGDENLAKPRFAPSQPDALPLVLTWLSSPETSAELAGTDSGRERGPLGRGEPQRRPGPVLAVLYGAVPAG
jgi:hypothetical protein